MEQDIESGQKFNEELVFVVPPDDCLRKPVSESGNSLVHFIRLANEWYESGQLKLSIYMFDAIVYRFGFSYFSIGGINYPHTIITVNKKHYAAVPDEIFQKAMYENSIQDRVEKFFQRALTWLLKIVGH